MEKKLYNAYSDIYNVFIVCLYSKLVYCVVIKIKVEGIVFCPSLLRSIYSSDDAVVL